MDAFDPEPPTESPVPLDPALAVDRIDELLARLHGAGNEGVGGWSAHLHCTDVPGEWVIRAAGDGPLVVTREHLKADVALRGPAADLLLVLSRQRPPESVQVFGDHAVGRHLLEAVARRR